MTSDSLARIDSPSNDNVANAVPSPSDVIARIGLEVLQETTELARGALPLPFEALGPRATMVRAAAAMMLRIAAWDCGEGGRQNLG